MSTDSILIRGAREHNLKNLTVELPRNKLIALKLDDDDIALMFGDHGPDNLGQLFTPGEEWSEQQRRERFGAFYAARVPECEMSVIGSLVNLGRRMLTCFASDEFPDLPTHIYDVQRSPDGSRITELVVPTT